MRASGIINFVLVTSATACLMGVVTKSRGSKTASADMDSGYHRSKLVMPPDSPNVDEPDEAADLPFKFKDNNGRPPMLDPKSKLYLEDPANIKTDVEYNPATGNYDIKQKIGDQDYRPETYMNLKEYKDYMFKKQMSEYWRSRVAADELNEKPRKGMIPKLQVNSELFDRIFGGNTVDIKPTGTAELIFGLNKNKNQNPAIPQKQQKITNFDFNMRIQLNLIGKIGEKLKVTTNYNTEASFDWENQVKIDYTGLEDEIIKKIEAGNVTLPLNSTLISGSQTLFGFKTELQFGKLRATTVFSQQKGKKQEITVQGGTQSQQFNVGADTYEQNKHYFLGHYFRSHYDTWMNSLPIINTPVVITKVDVYVLGVTGTAEQTRNVVAFEDLGEGKLGSGNIATLNDSVIVWPGLLANIPGPSLPIIDNFQFDDLPRNEANNLYSILTATGSGLIAGRSFTNVGVLTSGVGTAVNPNNDGNAYMVEGRDFVKIQNARRLNPSEYTFNSRTGYISLNQQLNNEQALAVSYQYTYGDKTYQVGEFSDQVPDNTQLLVCKLLKSNSVSVRHPMWKLMMKNVYAIGAYNLNPQDFKLDVYYNNIETGVDVPYLPAGQGVNGQQLIRVLNCDNLSVNGDRRPDGVYDFVNGYTVLTTNGRIYFPTVEPFGRSLRAKFNNEADIAIAEKYVFTELYDSTKTAATFIQNKNRFKIKGSYRSSSGSEIALNALNIPQGAVVVTANGIALVENTDYTVDYTLGRVKIINEGLMSSGATIKVSLESNSLFNVQQKSLWGTRLDYKAGRNLTLGSTILRFTERPLTQKVSIGDEPVSNIVLGLDYTYKTEAPFLTRLIDKLPFYSTKEMSTISTRGEFAKLFPGNAKAISKSGNSYVDDFEGSLGLIDIRSPGSWYLASVPQGATGFPEGRESNTINPGINRARFNWYNIDPMFTRTQSGTTPDYYTSKKLFSNNMWRQVFETELFPGKTPPNGQQVVLPVLDLGFYPSERGPYNYDVNPIPGISSGIKRNGTLENPESRWGGIMRRLETNDFQTANIEYIQFWMMDPFNEDYNSDTDPAFSRDSLPAGDLYINLGNISEDIVKDKRMVYENGIIGSSDYTRDLTVDSTNVADVPSLSPSINAFSADENDRPLQDVGYDGLGDSHELYRFRAPVADIQNSASYDQSAPAIQNFINDPSSDRYHFFRGDDYDDAQANTLRRYSGYNNPEGNSPTPAQYSNSNPKGGNYPTGATTLPNIEDINKDNTLNESENYYEYHVRIDKNAVNPTAVGSNFIVDAFDGTADFSGVSKTVKWYQFKIPISQFDKTVGGVEGFNSIRFMRVYMKGFARPVLLRMARFEFVRSDWRRYQFDLKSPGEYLANDDNSTSFDVSAVSLLENGNKVPVNYVLPPEIEQQQNVQTTNLVLQNEQALQMRVCDLKDGDSRAIFKNVDLDTRMFKNIKMNVHAEQLYVAGSGIPLNDGDLTLFFRVGSDYNDNFYEYSYPLKLTPKGVYSPNSTDSRNEVWPKENEINFKFDDITAIKNDRNTSYGYFTDLSKYSKPYVKDFGGYTITIVGNPNLGTVKSVMVGIRNTKSPDNLSHCAEVWINELRLTDFNNQGGWAATAQVQAKLADLGTVSLAGTYKTPFWGSVEQKINERSKETNFNWDMSTSINAGKFFPAKWKVTLPIFYNYGQTVITPLFNPLDPDQLTKDFKKNPAIPDTTKEKVLKQIQDFTERKGFNVTNMRIDGLKRKNAKPMPWDISNFSATYAYNEIFRRSINVEYNVNRQYRGNLQYAFNVRNPYTLKPFSKMKIFDKKAFAIIRDFNLQLLPNSFGTSIDVNRTYSSIKNRDITSFYAGANDFVNPALVNKNFTITRSYNFRWDISKSIKFDYAAINDGRLLELFSGPYGETYKGQKSQGASVSDIFFKGYTATNASGEATDTLGRRKVGRFGMNTVYRQQMNLNVDVPINKIPILDFMKVNYRYGGTYTWTRMPFAVADSAGIGNTIQNTNTHNITGNFAMMQLYNKIPYFKRVNTPVNKNNAPPSTGKGKATDTKLKTLTDTTVQGKTSNFKDIGEFLAKAVMMIKNITLNFQETGGQALPNFEPNSQYGGMDFDNKRAPGFLFTTGLYDKDLRQNSAQNGWLTKVNRQTTAYTEMNSRTISYKASVEPHGSLKIELTGNYTKSKNLSQYMLYDETQLNNGHYGYDFNVSRNETGNFNMSTFTFFRSFRDGGTGVNSSLFDEFRSKRANTAQQLAAGNTAAPGVLDGFSDNQQDVLLGTFYSTYVGRDIKNYSTKNIFPSIPLPNWNITWDGLGKLKPLKKTFKSVTVRHGYRSTYNINGYTNNLLFNADGMSQNVRVPVAASGGGESNWVPYYNINSVTLSESFSPLIKLDFQFLKPGWSANIETKRDKSTTLNLTGFQIIETKGQEYVLGIGYLYPKLKLKRIKIQGKVLESNLIVKVDVSFRRNISVIRDVVNGSSTPTGGTDIITLKSSADYSLTQNITLRLFWDWIRTKPKTSASFPTANTNIGFSLRINFQ